MRRKVAGVTAVLNGGRWGQANDHALGTRGATAGAATDDWGGRSRAAVEATGGRGVQVGEEDAAALRSGQELLVEAVTGTKVVRGVPRRKWEMREGGGLPVRAPLARAPERSSVEREYPASLGLAAQRPAQRVGAGNHYMRRSGPVRPPRGRVR